MGYLWRKVLSITQAMLGSLIGAGLSAAGSIYGDIKASKAMKDYRKSLQNQQAKNQAWYDKNYYQDATQRADALRIMQKTQDAIRNRNRQAAASAAMTGGTQEAQAVTNAANAQAMSDAMSDIALAGQQRKDTVEQKYMQRRDSLQAQIDDAKKQQAAATAQAVQGVTSAAGEFMDLV